MTKQLNFNEKLVKKIKKQKKKTNNHVLIVLVLTLLILPLNFYYKSKSIVADSDNQARLTLSFVGDIMLGRNIEKVSKSYTPDYLFKYVQSYLLNSDYLTGNFENPIILGDNYEKEKKIIHLKTIPESAQVLRKYNFTVVNLANNHMMDYKEKGLEDTIKTLKDYQLDFVGAGENLEKAKRISYKFINGLTVATLGITDSYVYGFKAEPKKGGILPANPTIFIPLVEEARKKADIVVVHIHWGKEYSNEVSPQQENMAKAIADAGADIIVGHHPHVLASVKKYKNTVIFYSLGNFIFDQGWSLTRESVLIQYKIYTDGSRRLELIPIWIREGQPRPIVGYANQLKKQKIFRLLTKDSNLPNYRVSDKLVIDLK